MSLLKDTIGRSNPPIDAPDALGLDFPVINLIHRL